MLDVARRHVPGADFIRADMETVEFEPGALGAVIAFDSINHVPASGTRRCSPPSRRGFGPGGMFVASLHGGDDADYFDPTGSTPDR